MIKSSPAAGLFTTTGGLGIQAFFADVLSVDAKGMMVQFEDRADRTRIAFSDRAWMGFIKLVFEN